MRLEGVGGGGGGGVEDIGCCAWGCANADLWCL